MTSNIAAHAETRALAAGLAVGAAVGLLLGGAYLAGGLAHSADVKGGQAAARPAALVATTAPMRAPPVLRGPLDVSPVLVAVTRAPAERFAGAALNPGRDLDCLADAVYYEARGETPEGQEAIAQVVMNRVRHPAFPKSVCGVVFQGRANAVCQFSFACNGAMNRPKDGAAWARAEQIAARALAGFVMPEVGSATNFHAAGSAPGWGLLRVAQVGVHVFYAFGGRAGPPPSAGGDDKAASPAAPRTVFASMIPGIGGGVAPSAAAASTPAPAAVSSAPAASTSPTPAKPDAAPAATPAAPATS